jgi:hypothetical protein
MVRASRYNVTLTAAICASLLIHGLAYDAMIWKRTAELAAMIPQGPVDLKVLILEKEKAKIAQLEVEDLFGEHNTKGKGANSSPGDLPARTHKADQDQAQLTPHPGDSSPGGNGGKDAHATQQKVVLALATSATISPENLIPEPPAASSLPAPIIAKPTTKPSPVETAVQMARASPATPKTPPQQPQPQTFASPGHGRAGEVGTLSDSESDEFSDQTPIVYRNGKVEAREGLKVRSVKPKLTAAGEEALAAMDVPVIIIKVNVDEQGNVTDADYIRRSHIAEVDLPHMRAAYEWHFEPTRDKSGRPHRDSHIIAFNWIEE